MSDMKVKDLAGTVGITAERLVEQLNEAGITVSTPEDLITEDQKQTLLSFLQKRHGKSDKDGAASPKKITLKRKSVSEIKLGGSSRQGGKSVSVEVRKKRTYVKRSATEEAEAAAELKRQREAEEQAAEEARIEQERIAKEEAERLREEAELQRKQKEAEEAALEAAKQAEEEAEEEARKAAEEEQKAIAEEEAIAKAEEAAKAEKVTEAKQDVAEKPATPEMTAAEIAHKKMEEADAKRRAANLARIEAENALKAKRKAREEEEALEKQRQKEKAEAEKQAKKEKASRQKQSKTAKPQPAATPADAQSAEAKKEKGGRRSGSKNHRDDKFEREELHVSDGKGRRKKKKGAADKQAALAKPAAEHGFSKPTAPVVHEVNVPDTISVSDLAQRMSVKAAEVIKALMGLGTMATINQVLDQDTAVIVVEEMGHIPKPIQENEIEQVLDTTEEEHEQELRAPVVTVMGHVDHGKTSLLDYIRRTKVTAGEAGGITQHIGAYKVKTSRGEIAFLDTPGHAAFTEMRSRGAKVTDIVILVVAADDGVMPQTIEAIQHSKAAESTLIVAVNKIDKEAANPDRVKQELANHEVIPEDWGGDVQFVPVSALTGQGVDELLDSISLQAEMMELQASKEGPAKGAVIEARLDKGRGTVVTVLVQRGTLRKGDIVVVGQEYGRVRALFNEHGESLNEAGPSTPVEVLGLSGTPSAGDELQAAPDERKAREIADFRKDKAREVKMAQQQAAKLDEMFSKMEEGDVKTLNVMVKADVHGSAEAVSQGLQKLSTEQVKVRVIATGVGGINETDAQLAAASDAILIGFNVRADNAARKVIAEKGLDVQYFSIIYDLLEVVTNAMTGMLEPVYKEEIIGLARVDDVFKSPKFGDIAGCLVTEGVVKRSNPIRVLRDNVVIYEGELESLRRFKDDVNEVQSGVECGIGVKNYDNVQPGDQIEVYERVLQKPTLR
jgi:translation initiation factor IF-2